MKKQKIYTKKKVATGSLYWLCIHWNWYLIDFLMIENPTNGKDVDVLVITNHFTRYAQAIVTTLQRV